jgi:hypothetical integral membrane protein (TIGR02206 family)
MTEPFQFSAIHLAILGATVVLPIALSLPARGRPRLQHAIGWILAGILCLNEVSFLALSAFRPGMAWRETLPMHLCDWAVVCTVIALPFRKRLPYEAAFFWSLGGSVQAILTPDIAPSTPALFIAGFFVSHCTAVISVVFLTWTTPLRPVPRSLWRVFLLSNGYLAVAAVVNLLLGTNYGYLCRKPEQASLLDSLGPWPFYILSLEVVLVITMLVLYLPFWVADRRKRPGS